MPRPKGSRNKPKITHAEAAVANEAAQTEYREQKKRGRPKKTLSDKPHTTPKSGARSPLSDSSKCNDGHPHGGEPCNKPEGHEGLHDNVVAATQTPPSESTQQDLVLLNPVTGEIVGPAKVLDLSKSLIPHYSHSFLKMVAQCSAQAYFKKGHFPQRKSFALERGSCVHHLLELFAKEGKDPVAGLPDAWRLYITDHVAEMNEDDQEKAAKEYDNTKRMLEEFVYENKQLFKERVRPEDIEVEFNLDIPLRLGDKTFTRKFNGKIDLVLWSEDRTKYRIIDYKGLALDTPIPTPHGWTTMADLKEGDEVFDRDGKPCRVVHKSEIHNRKCYQITFDDGLKIICDDEHRWITKTGSTCYTKLASGEKKMYDYRKESVKTAAEIAETLKNKGQKHHQLLNAAPLKVKHKELLLDPYLLGCWLGDGTTSNGSITSADPEIFEAFSEGGFSVTSIQKKKDANCETRTFGGLYNILSQMDLVGHKYIPEAYLWASTEQRLALLQGLMDTDGSWNKDRRQAVFTNINLKLVQALADLISSLGAKAKIHPITAKKGHYTSYRYYYVTFVPTWFNPFRLKRKADLVITKNTAHYRVITDVKEVPSVPTQCIEVDSPSHTYLCTRAMIPTHNTSASAPGENELALDSQFALYFYAGEQLYGKKASALDYYLLNGVHICRDKNGNSIRFSSKAHPRELGQRKSGCEITYALKVPKKTDEEIQELFNAYYAPLVVKYESGIVAKEGRSDVRNRCNLCTFSEYCATVREFPAPRII